MRILINVSTISIGGGFQVALNVIKMCELDNRHDYFYLLNSHFSTLNLPIERILILKKSPAGFFYNKQRKLALSFESEVNPDIVYSVGAPSYINFKNPEVLRLTNPWIIGAPNEALFRYSSLNKIKMKLKIFAQRIYLKKAKYFITQTQDAKNKIVDNLGKNSNEVKVIENVYSYNLKEFINPIDLFYENKLGKIIKILVLTAPYPHKNLEILIDVCKEYVKKKRKDFKFFLTIPNDQFLESDLYKDIRKFNLEDYFENLGKVSIIDLPSVFLKVNFFFLPTLLEVFSVSFLEAMIFERPILTSGFGFNTSVCKNAALYVDDILNPLEIVSKLDLLKEDECLRNSLVLNGKEIIHNYKSTEEIYKQHLSLLEEIYEQQK